jgi:putative ABC transport system substrate-binding protein
MLQSRNRFQPLSKHSFEPIRCRLLNLGADMKRREFLVGLAGAVTASTSAPGQTTSAHVIGFLNAGLPPPRLFVTFKQSLAERGFVEGRNLTIHSRFAEGNYSLLPKMAEELLNQPVELIVASPTPAAVAARAATATLPIVFNVPDDPVKLGLVASIARPGGNATGQTFLLSELGVKQLGLLRELMPGASRFGMLVNPANENAEQITGSLNAAAAALKAELKVVHSRSQQDIDAAFAELRRLKVQALIVGTDPLFFARRVQLATLAARHALPTIYNARDYAEVGGLMSYGTNLTEGYRRMAEYAARILNGEKPGNLPVVQSSAFQFIINLPTAKALGVEIPPTLLARADEVIE